LLSVPHASLEKQGIIPADEIAEVAALNYRKRRRAHEAGRNGESAARAMFVSYSRENAAWCKRLLPVLKVKANMDTLQPWHETELKTGDRWDKAIQTELEQMDIFLCLVINFSPPTTFRA